MQFLLDAVRLDPITPRSAYWIAYMHLTLEEYEDIYE